MAKKYLKLGKVLKKLLFDRDMRPIDLSRELKIPPPTIHRFITSKSTRPSKTSLHSIANFFSVTFEQLVGEAPLTETNQIIDSNEAIQKKEEGLRTIPVLSWNISEIKTPFVHEGKRIFVESDLGENAFALIMPDTSMENMFPRDSILIFDPASKATDRSYVLVHLHETEVPVFRQLLVDLDHKYLKPLNPDLSAFKMRLLNKNDMIIACLVESRHNFQQNHSSENIQETY